MMDTAVLEKIKKSLKEIVSDQIEKGVFSGCCIGLIENGEKYVFPFGNSGRSADPQPVDEKSAFDLASLTKPLVTSLSVLSLVEEGELGLNEPLNNFFRCRVQHCPEITVQHLLEHGAGFVAHRDFYKEIIKQPEDERKEYLRSMILREELVYLPGKGFLYSDLGFMILGMIVEKITGQSLDDFWREKIAEPMGLENGLFFNKQGDPCSGTFCATGVCRWSSRELYGLVHDDNCRSVGGVCGHAGLFGSGEAMVDVCQKLLQMYKGDWDHPAVSLGLLRERFTEKLERWVLGFDTPTGQVSSSGNYFSKRSIGHLGFTGTSFWIDLENERAVIFLTNRVWSDLDIGHIQSLRPKIHDLIVGPLTGR